LRDLLLREAGNMGGRGWEKARGRRREERGGEGDEREREKGNLPPLKCRSGYATANTTTKLS